MNEPRVVREKNGFTAGELTRKKIKTSKEKRAGKGEQYHTKKCSIRSSHGAVFIKFFFFFYGRCYHYAAHSRRHMLSAHRKSAVRFLLIDQDLLVGSGKGSACRVSCVPFSVMFFACLLLNAESFNRLTSTQNQGRRGAGKVAGLPAAFDAGTHFIRLFLSLSLHCVRYCMIIGCSRMFVCLLFWRGFVWRYHANVF